MDIFCETLIVLSLITYQAPVQEPDAPASSTFKVGNGVLAPVLRSKTEPDYSEQARWARYQGSVKLYIQISPSGRATNMKVVRSLGLGLDQKAMEAVAKWKFKPGTKEGRPVTVEATIDVTFKLSGDAWSIARNTLGETVLKSVPTPPQCKSSDAKLTISLTINPDGRVEDVQLVSSTNASLDRGVMDSVKKWAFDPVPQSVSGQIDVVCSVTHMH